MTERKVIRMIDCLYVDEKTLTDEDWKSLVEEVNYDAETEKQD